MNEMNNVILFPTLIRSLEQMEEESFDHMEDQEYQKALDKINVLLSHQYSSFEININKLHCLTKLCRLQEAEEFSEDLLVDEKNEYYFDYLGYYIMILYEQNNFNALMTTILEEEKKRKIPSPFNKKFRDIYRLCYQMNMMKANDLLTEFETAMENGNHEEQWYHINKWIQLKVEPSETIVDSLCHPKVHPVVKTKLLEVLTERNIDSEMTVEKFGQEQAIRPNKLNEIKLQPIYVETLKQLSYLEQNNPTLYTLIEELLYQYHYIRYPFLNAATNVANLTEAFIFVAKKNLSFDVVLNDEIAEDVQTIEICSQLYLNLIND